MTVLLAVVFTVVAWLTTFQLREYMQGGLDDKLHGAAMASLNGPGGGPAGDGGGLGHPHGGSGAVTVVLNADGSVRYSGIDSFNSQSLTGAEITALEATPVSGEASTVDLPTLGEYRVLSMPPGPEGPGAGRAIVGLPESTVTGPIDNLIATEAVLGVAAMFLVGFAGFALVRVSLRPLDRVAATAARIAKEPLDRGEVGRLARVPTVDTDPRTESGLVGAALNRMIDHVSAALEARHASETRVRQFVADASHELRTPLASIKGYAELTRRSKETVPPDTAYALGRVESEATRMTALVEDLLLLARLDAGRELDREPVDLAPLVVDAVRDAHAAVPDHKWEVRLPDDPEAGAEVTGDEHRLHQVLVNLLANAGKHTPPGTVVTASLAVENGHALLTVADDGPGIPPDLLPTVFERFARGDTSRARAVGSTGERSTGPGSTGLGLAIVAAVVASHGGDVRVTSVPGETVFAVRLPLA
ncbi:HAMP domain-containing histidine kinase [Streptacidiphilus sp. NEAU-YB345]|uniref:histidine kinase n=2 Tax=Streptacidiphilus fuscans TaxID=2789292 RepID=A0A931AYR0_9ACTN|nr:HAMP domain-containing histidine kinase [Streptacidiphilus fuscans]